MLKIIFSIMLTFCYAITTFAQSNSEVQFLVENYKLNAVVVVFVIILLGLFFTLFRLEKRLKNLEKDN
ncbi:MAG: hypothetical protein K1X55_10915 [Chitinophagales bacterium]|nr:hypothetical protein [Chitinophagales bacterium]